MKKMYLIAVCSMIFMFPFVNSAHSWDVPLDIDVIKIDFKQGSANGALDIVKRDDVEVPSPEWDTTQNPDRNEPCAYIKSQSSRQVEVCFTTTETNIDSILAYAEVLSGTGFGNLSGQTVYFSGTSSSPATFTTTAGSGPGSVGKRSFTWKWCVIKVNETILGVEDEIGNTGSHYHYTVLDEPQFPFDEAWTEILDYSCDWASGTTTESGAIGPITTNAYTNLEKYYLPPYTKVEGNIFYLTEFFDDIDPYVDCQDMSAVVFTFMRAIGGNQTYMRQIGAFNTKSIKPVGFSEWVTRPWDMHQVAYCNSGVYDACVMIREFQDENERIPTGENINGNYKNDIFFSGTWSPSSDSTKTYSSIR